MSGDSPSIPQLSKRQRQILGLLKQGKVNKEVAQELGIEVGTVKQHIVAIFKKLKVSNRTMAVSQTLEHHATRSRWDQLAAELTTEGLMEKRPCVVLSLALAGNQAADADVSRRFLGILAAAATAANAIFLTRRGGAGDILFGIQQASVWSVVQALNAARQVVYELQGYPFGCFLHGGIGAGLALAGMERFGGWSEDLLASSVIAAARSNLDAMPPQILGMDAATRRLLDLCDVGLAPLETSKADRYDLTRLEMRPIASSHWRPFVGRSRERRLLQHAVQRLTPATATLWCLEGEMGMGKTGLIHWLLNEARENNLPCHHLRFTPHLLDGRVYDLNLAAYLEWMDVGQFLTPVHHRRAAELLVLEDIHLLTEERRGELLHLCQAGLSTGRMVLATGRRRAFQPQNPTDRYLKLNRLTASESTELVSKLAPHLPVETCAEIVSLGAGVPLFLRELAQNTDHSDLPLTLLTAVMARLDPLRLDRLLLRQVASGSSTKMAHAKFHFATPDIASEALERALALNVLKRERHGRPGFVHPLVRSVVARLLLVS